MIVIDGKNITISKGDTLDVVFTLKGTRIANTDEIIFSVKTTPNSSEMLLQKTIPYTAEDKIEVVITADEMNKLTVGNKVYDILIKSNANKTTLNFPANLIIKEVVHNG